VVVVELLNTVWADRTGVHDALATSDQARAWLAAHVPEDPDAVDVPDLRLLRDALRRLAADLTGDPRPAHEGSTVPTRAAAVQVVDRLCATAPTWSALVWEQGAPPRREPRSDAQAGRVALASLAEQGVALVTGEVELRACLAPGCVLYFVRDHPRREWCSAGCGNRARVARHYRRHHAPEAG